MDVKSWTCEQTVLWVSENFNLDVAAKIAEHDINGEDLHVMWVSKSTCLLQQTGMTFKEQVKFYRLMNVNEPSTSSSSSSHSSRPYEYQKKKKDLTWCQRRILNAKRASLREKALARWPDNAIPNFIHDGEKDALQELLNENEHLTSPEYGFTKVSMREYVVRMFAERRRGRRKGRDYTKPDKRRNKKSKITNVETIATSTTTSNGNASEGFDVSENNSTSHLNSTQSKCECQKKSKDLPVYQRRILKAKRKLIREKALARWPENAMPNFNHGGEKGALLELLKENEYLASPEVGFTKASMREYVVRMFAERRRERRKGRDYTKPDGRKKKRRTEKTGTNDTLNENTSENGSTDDFNPTPSDAFTKTFGIQPTMVKQEPDDWSTSFME